MKLINSGSNIIDTVGTTGFTTRYHSYIDTLAGTQYNNPRFPHTMSCNVIGWEDTMVRNNTVRLDLIYKQGNGFL